MLTDITSGDKTLASIFIAITAGIWITWRVIFYRGRHRRYQSRHAYTEDCKPLMWDNRCGYIHVRRA